MTGTFQDRLPQSGRALDRSRSGLSILSSYYFVSRPVQVHCPHSVGVLSEKKFGQS